LDDDASAILPFVLVAVFALPERQTVLQDSSSGARGTRDTGSSIAVTVRRCYRTFCMFRHSRPKKDSFSKSDSDPKIVSTPAFVFTESSVFFAFDL